MKRYLVLICLLATGCATTKHNPAKVVNQSDDNTIVGGKLFTAVWMQRAAEYKALCEQAYNIATLRVNQYLQHGNASKPLAIVTDIDETFLDNSPYAVHRALQGKDYTDASWRDWTGRAEADTLCGALEFFKYAAAKGIAVFYITNRDEAERPGTLKNLQKFGFPFADSAHLYLSQGSSSKESRRSDVEKNYDIVLLLGDNLGDFSALFDHKTEAERSENVLNNKDEFGKKFIILPNPDYGDWEGALYHYNYKFTPAQKDSVFKANAKTY